jgi:eukaryotic-like serine/threonine-protein kinase
MIRAIMTQTGEELIGGQLGRYRIVDLIGRGGMACVYQAVLDGPLGFSRPVAIKQIRTDTPDSDEKLVRALINEARLGGQLSHPNVVDVLEFGELSGSFYIVMEFVDGLTLSAVLAQCRERGVMLPHKVALEILAHVASGLAYAHELPGEDGNIVGLIHRDLKPANILIGRSGQAMVADFGLAKSDSNLFQSTSVEVKGTPAYMSPEQVTCKPLTPASDLFSLGAILYEMLRGAPLFAADNMLAVVHKVAQVPMADELGWVRHHAPLAADLLESLVSKAPAGRPASARIVAQQAQELLRGFPAQADLADFMAWLRDEEGTADSMPSAGEYAPPTPTVEPTLTDEWHTNVYRPETVAVEPAVGGNPARGWWLLGACALALTASIAVWQWPRDEGERSMDGAAIVAPVVPTPTEIATAQGVAADDKSMPAIRGDEGSPVSAVDEGILRVTEANQEASTPPEASNTGVAVDAPLIIDCRPWCDLVRVDGDEWGASPQLGRRVTVGAHDVWLRAAAGGTTAMNVDVPEGGVKVCWDFERNQRCEGV